MQITREIENLLNSGAKKAGVDKTLSVSFSNMPKLCDFQCNDAFALGKACNTNPFDLASKIVENIKKSEDFTFEVAKPAFINIKLTDKKLAEIVNTYLLDEMSGVEKHKKSQKVILDYGGANVAKALHAGHLRSPITGEGLKRLYKLLGDEVIADVHLGDWGLQMGLTELELYEEGILDFYFGKSTIKPQLTLEMLNEAYPKASARKDKDSSFKEMADEWTLKIQRKEQPYYDIYQEIRRVSIEKIKENYQALGATFDLWYGESDAAPYIDKAIKIIKDKGLAKESEGALVVDVAVEGENIPIEKKDPQEVQRYKNPMPPAIIQKYNGAALYATTDIATILMRNETIKDVDRIEYIVDARQKTHFVQVFRVCKMAGISPEHQQLIHIGYGTMNGKDGKPFKTRSGDTVKLSDIIDLLIDKASEKLKSNNVKYDRATALKIGVGAMKFGDLINNVGKDYIFDLDKFLSFEGKTGPYLQYSVVRINSILNKIKDEQGQFFVNSEEERNIIRAIIKLNSAYEIAYNEKSLSSICGACYDLASAFSTFYNNFKIINEQDRDKRTSYITLIKLVKEKLEQALGVLAIEVPEKM